MIKNLNQGDYAIMDDLLDKFMTVDELELQNELYIFLIKQLNNCPENSTLHYVNIMVGVTTYIKIYEKSLMEFMPLFFKHIKSKGASKYGREFEYILECIGSTNVPHCFTNTRKCFGWAVVLFIFHL